MINFFRVKRVASGVIPYAIDQSINIDYCGESQGCLIVPQQCNNDAKCEYTLSWQVLSEDTARFHIIARAQGFVGVGFSNDEKRVRINSTRTYAFVDIVLSLEKIFISI